MSDTLAEPRVKDEHSPSKSWLIVCALLALVLIGAARLKGGYIDEYWTMSFADSSVPLQRAFQAWSMDTGHPIGFYVISRIGDLVLAPDIFIRRLANLLFFGLALLWAWAAGKRYRAFGLIYVTAVAASPYVVERFAEYRASFLVLMITSVIVIRMRAIVDANVPRRSDFIAIALLMAALGLSDYPVAIAGLALCGALALLSLLQRDRSIFMLAAGGIAACLLVVALSVANAARFPMYASPYHQSFAGLARDLAVVLVTAALPCIVIASLALFHLVRAPVSALQLITRDRFNQLLIVSLALMLLSFILINGATHGLIRRQLFGVIPIAIALLLNLSWPYFRLRPAILGMIALNILGVSAATAYYLKSKVNFDRFGEQMAQAQRACPTLPIYAVLPDRITGNTTNPFPIPNQVALGFRDVARRHGFKIRGDFPTAWIDPQCGAIIWSEYLWMSGKPSPQQLARKLGLEESLLATATTEYVDQSLLMRVAPPR